MPSAGHLPASKPSCWVLQSEKVMDVDSKGGAWTRKSPKLLLLEWTQGQKRPKPRYKTLPEEGGMFRCKVGTADASANMPRGCAGPNPNTSTVN